MYLPLLLSLLLAVSTPLLSRLSPPPGRSCPDPQRWLDSSGQYLGSLTARDRTAPAHPRSRGAATRHERKQNAHMCRDTEPSNGVKIKAQEADRRLRLRNNHNERGSNPPCP